MTATFLTRPIPFHPEDAGKDHDEPASNAWQLAVRMRMYLRLRTKRVFFIGCMVLLTVYLFTHRTFDYRPQRSRLPRYDTAGGDDQYVTRPGLGQIKAQQRLGLSQSTLANSPPEAAAFLDPAAPRYGSTTTKHYYEGEINLDELYATVRSVSRIGSWHRENSNVLFCASSSHAVARLLPVACDMASQGHNVVHLMIVGRNPVSIDDMLSVNGVDRSCKVAFHDGRPDHAPYSTDTRAESSVIKAMEFLNQRIQPQAVITSVAVLEDHFFARAMTKVVADFDVPLIQIPNSLPRSSANTQEDLAWITRLDAAALNAWNKPDIQIIVQVDANTAGKVNRLLESLARADYVGTTPPRVTLDLPSETDGGLLSKLSTFQWPPGKPAKQRTELNVRRRIPIHSASDDEAAVRFMESFYPTNSAHSHVLILSADAIVTPLYYQALRYHLLQVSYSRSAAVYPPLMGIALNLPKTTMTDMTPVQLPNSADLSAKLQSYAATSDFQTPFFWTAPNTDAALYFGNLWIEMHTFVSYRLTKTPTIKATPSQKMAEGSYAAAWADYALEFMQTRGLSLFYAGAASARDPLVTTSKSASSRTVEQSILDTPADAAPQSALGQGSTSTDTTGPFRRYQPRLLDVLPFRDYEPSPFALPQLATNGTKSSFDAVAQHARVATELFRQSVGGCTTSKKSEAQRKSVPGTARDLFCFGEDTVV